MENFEIIRLDTTASTSRWIAENGRSLPHGACVTARCQTAGRGQRGNSWEAAPGLNVTLSGLLRPEGIDISAAFPLSEAVAEAVADTVACLLAQSGVRSDVKIKWPNDIYVSDKKIAGILIENSLRGRMVERSIVGIGLNVNQREFVSDAPNPVSVFQLTGAENDVDAVALDMWRRVMEAVGKLAAGGGGALHDRYMKRLWRGTGVHAFLDVAAGKRFDASVADVAPSGHITLCDAASGSPRVFAFKEIVWL